VLLLLLLLLLLLGLEVPVAPRRHVRQTSATAAMGTNNPSEDQLQLVESRIIALADTVVDPGLPMDGDSYFDEHGFDLESAAGQLSAKLKRYCADQEGLEPSLEDHPQVRRMARYLLENVDYEVLDTPLPPELLSMKATAIKSTSGSGTAVGGVPRHLVIYGGVALAVLAIFLVLYFVLGSGGVADDGTAKPHHEGGHRHSGGGSGGGGGGGRGRAWRNQSQ
jgi:hypothetical protein